MRRYSPYTFTTRWVLLCEGESDKRFFDRLIAERQIRRDFYVQFPDRGERGTGGRSKFGWWLETNRNVSETFRSIEAILIVSDKDDNPSESFRAVQREIEKAKGFPVPERERVPARANGFPTIVVLMIPMDGIGNL